MNHYEFLNLHLPKFFDDRFAHDDKLGIAINEEIPWKDIEIIGYSNVYLRKNKIDSISVQI